jgi:hypothetical protein
VVGWRFKKIGRGEERREAKRGEGERDWAGKEKKKAPATEAVNSEKVK